MAFGRWQTRKERISRLKLLVQREVNQNRRDEMRATNLSKIRQQSLQRFNTTQHPARFAGLGNFLNQIIDTSPEAQQDAARRRNEAIVAGLGSPLDPTGAPSFATPASQRIGSNAALSLITPLAPETGIAPIDRNIRPLTSPLGLYAGAVAPGLVLGGTTGAVGGSLLGGEAERLGAPRNIAGTGIGTRTAAELLGGAALGGLEAAGARRASLLGAGRTIEETGGLGAQPGRLLRGEQGGTQFGGSEFDNVPLSRSELRGQHPELDEAWAKANAAQDRYLIAQSKGQAGTRLRKAWEDAEAKAVALEARLRGPRLAGSDQGISNAGDIPDVPGRRVFHGTSEEAADRISREGFVPTESTRMTGFIPTKATSPAFFFTEDKGAAAAWAANRSAKGRGRVIEAQISLKRPYPLNDAHFLTWDDDGIQYLRDTLKISDERLAEFGIDADNLEVTNPNTLSNLLDDPEVVAGLKQRGYDGAIINEGGGQYGGLSYAVFDRSQIRAPDVPGQPPQDIEGRIVGETEAERIARNLGAINPSVRGRVGGVEFGSQPPREPPTGVAPEPPSEPPKPLNAGATNPVAKVWNFMLSSPGDEKGWVQSFRRMRGELEHQGTAGRVERKRLVDTAKKSGLKLTHERTPENERILALMEGVDVPEATAAERALAQELRAALDAETQAMIAADPSFAARALDDYVPRMFKDVEPTTPKGATVQSRQRPFFLKGRTQPGTTLEVLDRLPNKDLVTWNPIDLVQLRINRGIQWRAEQQFLEALESQGLALPRGQAPADWVVPESPLFKGTAFMRLHSSNGIPPEEMAARFRAKAERLSAAAEKMDFSDAELVGGREVADDIAVPKDAAKFINDMIGKTSAFNTNVPGQAIKKGSQGIKTVKVLGGLFQYFDYSYRTLAGALGQGIPIGPGGLSRTKYAIRSVPAIARSWVRGFVPAFDNKMLKYDLSDPVRSQLLKEGLQVEGGLDIMEREIGDILKEPGFLARNGVTDKVATKRAKAIADYMTSGAYGRAHREFLLSYAEMLTDDFMRRGMSIEEAAARAARDTHEKFSSLPAWQSVFRSPTTRDGMRVLLFAPNEAEGWARNYFRLFQPRYAEQAGRFWAGMAATTLASANMIHYISTGNLLPQDRYSPVNTERKGALGFPVSYKANFMRPDLPWKGSLGRDLYLDLLGQGDTVLRFAFDPAFSAKSRLNVLPGVGVELAPALEGHTPQNFGGEPMTGWDYLKYGAEKAAPIPAGSFLDEAERIGFKGAAVQSSGWNISGQPNDELLAEKFKEITGREYNPEVDNEYARTLEPLQPIFAEIDKRRLARGTPSAIERKERSEFLDEQAKALRIPEMAKAFNSGNEAVGPQLLSAYEDYSKTVAIATARDMYGNDFGDPESEEGQALKAWREITPQQFQDSETFIPDWDAYYDAKDAAYAALPESYRRTYEARLRLTDPSAREAEAKIKEARTLQNTLYDTISPIKELPPDEYGYIRDFEREVAIERDYWLDEFGRDVPWKTAIDAVAADRGTDPTIVDWAHKLRSSSFKEKHANPDWFTYLSENEDKLRPFFPNLYTRGVLSDLFETLGPRSTR